MAVTLLLLLGPSLLLWRWSRPRAEGLEQLMGASSLLQSFAANPDRAVPALWLERLGPELAIPLWRSQGKVWWQFWASHGEAAPYLALPAGRFGAKKFVLPPQALRVGDLIVYAENPIARQQLLSSLRPLQRRSSGLAQRCHQRLQTSQTVYWQADALGTILGPVAPLLERYQIGCLSLALEPGALRWQGEAMAPPTGQPTNGSSRRGADQPKALVDAGVTVEALASQPPLAAELLLELEGSSLDQLLQGLLARQMIRDPLASRYGLEGAGLALAKQAPFRLRLRPQTEGPFQASLELQIIVAGARSTWINTLDRVRSSLLEQGLTPIEGEAIEALTVSPQADNGFKPGLRRQPDLLIKPAGHASQSAQPAGKPANAAAAEQKPSLGAPHLPKALAKTTLWRRSDGTQVGGWRWLSAAGGEPQLLLFLGPPPLAPLPMAVEPDLRPAADQLWLRVRPAALDGLGLLPPEMPPLVRQGSQLWLNSEQLAVDPSRREAVSRLSGRLQLKR